MKNLLHIGSIRDCAVFEEHAHETWEMIYYTGGRVRLDCAGQSLSLSEGSFALIPPHTPHSETGDPTFDDYFFGVTENGLLPVKLTVVKDTVDRAIRNLILQMHFVFHSKPGRYRQICEAQLNVIAQYVQSQLGSRGRANPYVEQVALEILTNASANRYSISDAEDRTPYSRDYFRLLFQREMGCTPVRYLNRVRMENAKNLLAGVSPQNGLSIAAVSAMCGFSDPLYFSRCFKKHTGLPPTEWARRSRSLTDAAHLDSPVKLI